MGKLRELSVGYIPVQTADAVRRTIDVHGHMGEIVVMRIFLVVGEEIEDSLAGFMADAGIQRFVEAVVTSLNRGMDGVDKTLGDRFSCLEYLTVGGLFKIHVLEDTDQLFSDELYGQDDAMLFVEMEGLRGDAERPQGRQYAGAEHAPLDRLDHR